MATPRGVGFEPTPDAGKLTAVPTRYSDAPLGRRNIAPLVHCQIILAVRGTAGHRQLTLAARRIGDAEELALNQLPAPARQPLYQRGIAGRQPLGYRLTRP